MFENILTIKNAAFRPRMKQNKIQKNMKNVHKIKNKQIVLKHKKKQKTGKKLKRIIFFKNKKKTGFYFAKNYLIHIKTVTYGPRTNKL